MALDDFDTHESTEGQIGKPAPRPVPAPAAKPAVVAKPVITTPAPKSLDPDDEDLFDFPVVEMKLEASVAAPLAAPAPARALAPVATPAAKKPVAPAPQKPVSRPARSPSRPRLRRR